MVTQNAEAARPDAANDGNETVTRRRFVRILQEDKNGLVQFEFAIGWPDLAVELALPRAAFDEFCAQNAVRFVTEAEIEAEEAKNINKLPVE